MKVAITLNTSWNIYNFRFSLIEELLKKGHEVIAIAPRDEFTEKLIKAGCKFEDVTMDSRGANPIKDLGLTRELYLIYKRVRPDVILQYTIKPNIYGSLAASRLGIPVINNISGLGTIFLNDNFISKVALSLYRYSFKFPKKVFFQNHEDLQLFLDKKLIQKNICEVIPGSGIDLDHFQYQEYTYKQGNCLTFLMISRLIIDKGIREYIAAAQALRERGLNAKFQLLGGLDVEHSRGISKEELEEWIDEGYIEYLGRRSDVRPFIHEADCIVLPSYREGTPRTLLEAAACGKPIIATNVPGCTNVVDHTVNGYLCRVKDDKDLAMKMKDLFYAGDEVRHNMAKAGRKIVERKFNQQFVIDRYLDTIDKYCLRKAVTSYAYAKA